MTKLQITLTPQETVALGYGASNLGYSLTKFVKFLLGQKAVEVSNSIPVYQMSKKAIRDTEVAAITSGINTTYYKLLAFIISAAKTSPFVSPVLLNL